MAGFDGPYGCRSIASTTAFFSMRKLFSSTDSRHTKGIFVPVRRVRGSTSDLGEVADMSPDHLPGLHKLPWYTRGKAIV
jgi:hypothetical protein